MLTDLGLASFDSELRVPPITHLRALDHVLKAVDLFPTREERKRDVLAVVRQFGILLLEDDPYLFLSFEGLGEEPVTRIRSRSYWSLEMEDRDKFGDGFVARFDSFSKVSYS